jgi:hypothetical protein
MEVSPTQLTEALTHCLRANLVAMVTGSPGCAKSDIIKQTAEKYNLEFIDIRLSQIEPVDLSGFPVMKNRRMEYAPTKYIPLKDLDKIPDGKSGWLICFEEMNSASLSTQAASYRVILDREIGDHKVHPKAFMMAAGNKQSDGAIVNRLGTAMQSRLVHLMLTVNAKDWLAWAATNNLDYRVTSYIEHRPDILHKFKPDHNDQTFASPRTWHFLSKLITNQTNLKDMLPVLAGTVSEGVAREFVAYTDLCTRLPSIKDILNSPLTTHIDNEPSMLYAVSHMVAAYMDQTNVDKLMEFVTRLPLEYGTVTVKAAAKRQPILAKTQPIKDFRSHIAKEMF